MTKVFFIELAGVAFIVPLVYYWLGIGEASTGELLWSLLVGMAAVGLAAFLLGLGFTRDWKQALRRTHWLSFVVFGFLLWVAVCLWCEPWLHSLSRWLASWVTMVIRQPVDPYLFSRWVLRPEVMAMASFVLVAAPVAAWVTEGRRASWWVTLRYLGYGLVYLVAGLVLPVRLFSWVPSVTGAGLEMVSFLVRTGFALAIATGAWLWFAGFVRREAFATLQVHPPTDVGG